MRRSAKTAPEISDISPDGGNSGTWTGETGLITDVVKRLTDGLRGELKPFGVRVTLIRPGFILTEFVEAANTLWRLWQEVDVAAPSAEQRLQ